MRKYLLLALAAMAMASCTPKETGGGGSGDSTKVDSMEKGHSGILGMDREGEIDAVIVGSGVRSREKPSTEGTIIRPFEQGELVTVVDMSEERAVLSKDGSCDEFGYFWYKVKDHSGKESWIYGKYIFRFKQMQSARGRVTGGQTLKVGGKDYIFQLAMDEGYGPSNSEGLTGCDRLYIPFLYHEGDSKAMLFHIDTKKIKDEEIADNAKVFDTSLLLLTAESDGGSDMIEEVRARDKEPVIEFDLTHSYQDGESKGRLVSRVSPQRIDVVEYVNEGMVQ